MRFYFYNLALDLVLKQQDLSHFNRSFLIQRISTFHLVTGDVTASFLPVRIVNLYSKLLLPKVQVFQLLPLVQLEGIKKKMISEQANLLTCIGDFSP